MTFLLEMLEAKPRNIQDYCDASNLSSLLHSDELKQSEGSGEQFLTAGRSGVPLTKPKLSIFTEFLYHLSRQHLNMNTLRAF